MALIENSKGRKEGSNYQRLFGNEALGYLLSRVHATVITAGIELEKLIIKASNEVENVDDLLHQKPLPMVFFL